MPSASTTRKPSTQKTLTLKCAKFVTEYLTDFNGRQAAIRAGYSAKTADQAASRMLRMPAVKAALNKGKVQEKVLARADAINRMELTVERTKLEIARLAYFDPRKAWDENGDPIPLHKLDDDTAAAIAGFEVLEQFEGSGEDRRLVGHLKKYKVSDKNAALEKASKILGLYEKDNEQRTDPLRDLILAVQGHALKLVKEVSRDHE